LAGELLFKETPPNVTQPSKGSLQLLFPLQSRPAVELSFGVSVFEGSTQTSTDEISNSAPLDVFDYRQAIIDLNVSYIALRDPSQIPRFTNDPAFSLLFMNREVAIFEVHSAQR
jgi:hypothetical protein